MRSNKALRQAIAVALQGDRTSDSIVPTNVPGHTAAFPLGGKAKPKVTWESRINLTLGYDASMPNGHDIANQIRGRLENTGGLSVQLKPGVMDADLNCGQMHGNSGYDAAPLVERFGRVFAGAEAVVSPSASCVGFVRERLDGGPPVYELSEFVVDVLGVEDVGARSRIA